jgi:hypothetical protein
MALSSLIIAKPQIQFEFEIPFFVSSSTGPQVARGKEEESQATTDCCNCWAEPNQPYEGLSGVLGNIARTVLRGLLFSNGEWLLDFYGLAA